LVQDIVSTISKEWNNASHRLHQILNLVVFLLWRI